MKRIRVWDLPIRLFHWTLALLIVGLVITANISGNMMVWHFRFGYAVLTLILFRLVWGVIGTHYARFANFLVGPGKIAGFLSGRDADQLPGHNPLGSLAVVALLLVVFLQAALGLFSNDDIAADGPLANFVSKEMSDKMSHLHADLNIYLLYALIALHVLAIAWYFFGKKKNLLTPMLTGDVITELDVPAADDSGARRLQALLVLAACAGLVLFIVNLKP
jgi:cytochrome b